MRARAPGKLVLSGAYSVLEGAPALVVAVDRYVTADSARHADLITREVATAVSDGAIDRPPWFDASALRQSLPDGSSRKLGLGSSAAILVASLGAMLGERFPDESALRAAILPMALSAHRRAQGGGSGIDVAASVLGGVLCCRLNPVDGAPPLSASGPLEVASHPLPAGVHIEVFASPTAAETPDLLGRVRSFAVRYPAVYGSIMREAESAACRAVAAASAPEFVEAVRLQFDDALRALSKFAKAPIVTEEVAELVDAAWGEGAAFGPSGAGGGDIAIFVGDRPASAPLQALAAARGLRPLDLRLGARGLHLAPAERA